jgi:hypothetical protein
MLGNRACPGCGSKQTRLLHRKHVFTALYQCRICCLMYRVPKGSLDDDRRFYTSEYAQEWTTAVPSDEQLQHLRNTSFRDIGKDYSHYIAILRALGVTRGSVVYDYGSSWGYGSYQFLQAGYRVYSYEIADWRLRFAERKLGCRGLDDPTDVPEEVDCFFASHVVEHLADPNVLWRTARSVLGQRGVVVLAMPNGEPSRATVDSRRYHQLWGRVHPLLLSSDALCWMAKRHGFSGVCYSSPYGLEVIASGEPGTLDGDELLFVARPDSAHATST